MGAKAFFVGDQGMCKLLGTSTGRSSHAKVDFRSLVELQLPGVCFNVLGELPILGRGASFGRPMRGEFLSFEIASFHSSIGSPVVDTCNKAVVKGAICHLDAIPLTIKSAMWSTILLELKAATVENINCYF
ncbi:hypothetical protein GW17_00013773 [Ensete ventricosum]|nr:hypothetical protein GW17_00013773 [Ensete ventricosum]